MNIISSDLTASLRLLLKYGANVNVRDLNSRTPLHWACNCEFPDAVRILLEYGADANALDSDDESPLHYAVACYDPSSRDSASFEVVRILLAAGADINAQSKYKQTPLFVAVATTEPIEDAIEMASFLIDHGASLKIADFEGKIPIDAARHEEVRQFLLTASTT